MITKTVEYLHKGYDDRKMPSSNLEHESLVNGKPWLKASMPKSARYHSFAHRDYEYVMLYKSV